MPYLNVNGVGQRKEGDYQGHHYDFRYLYGIDENGNWQHYKVRSKLLEEVGFKDVSILEGNEIDIFGSSNNVTYLKIHG